jgi:hypothetical protein
MHNNKENSTSPDRQKSPSTSGPQTPLGTSLTNISPNGFPRANSAPSASKDQSPSKLASSMSELAFASLPVTLPHTELESLPPYDDTTASTSTATFELLSEFSTKYLPDTEVHETANTSCSTSSSACNSPSLSPAPSPSKVYIREFVSKLPAGLPSSRIHSRVLSPLEVSLDIKNEKVRLLVPMSNRLLHQDSSLRLTEMDFTEMDWIRIFNVVIDKFYHELSHSDFVVLKLVNWRSYSMVETFISQIFSDVLLISEGIDTEFWNVIHFVVNSPQLPELALASTTPWEACRRKYLAGCSFPEPTSCTMDGDSYHLQWGLDVLFVINSDGSAYIYNRTGSKKFHFLSEGLEHLCIALNLLI